MKSPPSDSFRDVFRQRVWTLDRMTVIHLQSAYRSFLYPPSFFSQNLPLILSRPLLLICHSHTHHIFCPFNRISISGCGLQGFPLVRRFSSVPLQRPYWFHTVRRLAPPFTKVSSFSLWRWSSSPHSRCQLSALISAPYLIPHIN